jgi:small conductance mechanosensitive channel
MIGVETTSFVAILAAAGFAIGLALQGSLGNFAGGVLILLFKPFKVGDFIEAQGETGSVKKIQIFNTILTTGDNKTIIIPNGPLSNGNITNYSTQDTRRVDMVFGIGYDDDIKKAKTILEKMIKSEKRAIRLEDSLVAVGELADSSVNFKVRVWVNSGDYWGVYHDFHENVKLTFDKEGISIPYPQMDIHQYKK